MKRLLRKVLNKEDYKKVMLIKKYAKIRFKRFWIEWGVNKKELIDFIGCISIFGTLYLMYLIGYMF